MTWMTMILFLWFGGLQTSEASNSLPHLMPVTAHGGAADWRLSGEIQAWVRQQNMWKTSPAVSPKAIAGCRQNAECVQELLNIRGIKSAISISIRGRNRGARVTMHHFNDGKLEHSVEGPWTDVRATLDDIVTRLSVTQDEQPCSGLRIEQARVGSSATESKATEPAGPIW